MISSKTILKFTALSATAFQGWAVYHGQSFSAMIFCGGIASLFTINSAHEHLATFMDMKYGADNASNEPDSGICN